MAKFRKHGLSRTRIYQCWADMKARCLNKSHRWYSHYGERGITVCDEWMQFEPFAEWAFSHGYADDLTIDRIDNNKGYCPEYCKWSTQHEQSMNKSHLQSKTGFVGVRAHSKGGFMAEVTRHGKYHYIGYYKTAVEAHEAREAFLRGGLNGTA